MSIPIPPGGEGRARDFDGGPLGLVERDVPPHLDPSRFVWFRAGVDLELHRDPFGNLVELTRIEK